MVKRLVDAPAVRLSRKLSRSSEVNVPNVRRLILVAAVGAGAVAMALTSTSIVSAAGPSPADTATITPREKRLPQSDKAVTITVDPSTGRVLEVSEGKSSTLGGKTVNVDPLTGQVLSLSTNGK
ncbi:hypothetical protein ACFYY8_24180 [Streptosporangium sp. NPDC001559]|uniref:hypothetical protein n=1 Tax=Streptosporangium sp. NPDC001559 TaxID=3366187 RepID=UPI0036E1A1C7